MDIIPTRFTSVFSSIWQYIFGLFFFNFSITHLFTQVYLMHLRIIKVNSHPIYIHCKKIHVNFL